MNESHPSDANMPSLPLMQRWFQAVITHPDGVLQGVESPDAQAVAPLTRDQLEQMIAPSKQCTAQQRIHVYAHAYFARLIECLGESFPVLNRVLGEELFSGFAFGFLQDHPSRSYTLNDLGRAFPCYLAKTRPPADEEGDAASAGDWADFMIELATFEWAIDEVFDGPGIERLAPLSPDALTAVPAAKWPDARLELAPCVRLLAFRYPINNFFTAIRKAPPDNVTPIPEPELTWTLITRRDYVVRRMNLTQTQHAILSAMAAGHTIGESIAQGAMYFDESEENLVASLRQWFTLWTSMGLFTRLDCQE